MEGEVVTRLQGGLEHVGCRFGASARRHDSQPQRDSVNQGIDGHRRHVRPKEKHARIQRFTDRQAQLPGAYARREHVVGLTPTALAI